MDEIIAKLEVCMATLDKMAARRESSSIFDKETLGRPYTSMVKVDGKPILSPLMTPDKIAEMSRYKAMAIQREREREERKREERTRQKLVARVETIVNSYEDSRQSLDSKENTSQQAANTLPGQDIPTPGMQSVETKPAPAAQHLSNPSYSPLKYMEMDEDEWNVRPATPWRRTKQSKMRTVIAANFDPRGHQPISSTMRMDHSQDIRGTTPDVSAISMASSQASNILPGNPPVDAVEPTPSSSIKPVLKEVLPSSPPGLESLKVITTEGNTSLPVDVSGHVGPDVNLDFRDNLLEPCEKESDDHSVVQPPHVCGAHVDSAVISRLSPIPKIDAVQTSGAGVAGSTGSQSTNSSSSNSALNQTVIDLSQMSLVQAHTSSEKAGDSSKPDINNPQSQPQSPLSTEAKARIEQVKNDKECKDTINFVPNPHEDNHAIGYLSDTESYMSLLGEYSLLPAPGSKRGTPEPIPKRDAQKVPFFTDPTSPNALGVKHEAETPKGIGQEVEGIKSDMPATDASAEPGESWKSVDNMSCSSSLGTLAQSVTLPISLSVTSESTLHGVEETWDRTSQDVTPTETEGTMSIASDELTSAGMVRAAPVGQESNTTDEVRKQTISNSEETVRQQSPSADKPLPTLSSGRTASDTIEKAGVRVERSGVKVDSDFQTPFRHHARKSSYTLDFPSPALLDAEARHQAPHVSGRDVSYTEAGSEIKEANVEAVNKTKSGQGTVSDEKQPDELSSEMKDLKIEDVSEAKVLSLQLSCLEQMQQRLQRQHKEQMNELMLQQSQELCLLQCEMEGIRRQAVESALGHVDDKDVIKTSMEVPTLHDESMKEDQKSTKENSSDTKFSKPPLGESNKKAKESPKVATNPKKVPPSSPSSRKRRFEESSGGSMIEVPLSYIKESALAGKGYAFPGFHSPVSEKLLANAKKKLTPQDSLESDHGGLVEVPPSYIKSGNYHRPVSRSPTHQRSLATSADTTTGSTHLASPSIPIEGPSVGDSSQLTTWGTPLKEISDGDSTKLSTWASPALGKSGGSGHVAVADPVHSLSDSFFLNDDQNGGMPDRHDELMHQQTTGYFRPWTITLSLQMDSRFDKLSARVKGYLTRALMRTPKVKALVKTIKDTQVFLYQFQAETPVKRGKLSEQDTKLAHRVLAQLRAAQYELDDIFHIFPIHQRMAILRHTREQERENFFTKKVSPGSAGQKAKLLSAATKKAMERRQQLAKEGDVVQSGPKRQKLVPANQRPKSAAETRVLRPLQSHKSPARPATAVPPRMSTFSITTQSQKVKSSVLSKPFPSKPVMVSRNTTKTTRSPSRPSSRPASTRPTSTRPTSRLSGAPSTQARTSSARQAKSPARAAASSQTKTKSVRRSLYPVTVGTGKKTMQRKQADTRKP